jgi:hypothetical protein
VTVTLKKNVPGTLVTPDGSFVPLKKGEFAVTIPHGAWMELMNEKR